MPLTIYDDTTSFRAACDRVRGAGRTLGLVPTMGALHAGHLALMHEARRRSSEVAVTLFVNPTQFSAGEDLDRYPRSFERDVELCEAAGATLLFAPSVAQMYPAGESTRVRVAGLTDGLCGAFRPGHFEGVATIVAKLFGLAGACTAVFGRKDYQQLKVIERMTRDLMLPITIVGYPTVREADGLAMSSRNAYLSPEQRQRAVAIPRGLSRAAQDFAQGERRPASIVDVVESELADSSLTVQYVELTHPDSLEPYRDGDTLPERALLAVAAFCEKTRLIDNLVLGEDPGPYALTPGTAPTK